MPAPSQNAIIPITLSGFFATTFHYAFSFATFILEHPHTEMYDEQSSRIMVNPLLSTKFFIPNRDLNWYRVHASDQLSDSLNRKLTLISAPAGFGKTTLISEWVEKNDKAVAAFMDEDDCNLSKFLVYLVLRSKLFNPEWTKRNWYSCNTTINPLKAILIDLLNQISSISDDFLLVLETTTLLTRVRWMKPSPFYLITFHPACT